MDFFHFFLIFSSALTVLSQDLEGISPNRAQKKVISIFPINTKARKWSKLAKTLDFGQNQAQHGPRSPERPQKVANRILGPIWVATT